MPDQSPCPLSSVARLLVFPLLFPVVPFSGSVSDKLKLSVIEDICSQDCVSSCSFTDGLSDCRGDGLTARREACCLEDAVFSRTPNWVGRSFMFARRPLQEPLLLLFGCCGCLCVGLPTA